MRIINKGNGNGIGNGVGQTGNIENYEIGSIGTGIFENLKWFNTNETAEYLRVSPKQIRKWVYQGRLKAYKLLGKSLRFKKSELDFILERGRTWQ